MNRQNDPISPEEAIPRITALLKEGRTCRLVVTGSSMLPFLRHKRDAVLLGPVDGEIRVGDILFYLRGADVCILHRVCGICPDGTLLLCGDAQSARERVSPEQVLGRVSHIERNGRLIDCGALPLQVLTTIWRWLRPVRPYILRVLRKIRHWK